VSFIYYLMKKLNNNNIKLAIQKDGRLTEETIRFLLRSGLDFENYKQRLFSNCRNFPLEILFVRNNDIPDYVSSGTVDLGIIGQNLLYELRPARVKKLINLKFGFCSLQIAVPNESSINCIKDLEDKKVSTSYPNSVSNYFKINNVKIKVIKINGSVEITPSLGVSDAVADLVSTGSTLILNDLRSIATIYQSDAVLIENKNSQTNTKKKILIDKLLIRFKGVLSADSYKYVMMNAPEKIVPRLTKIIPGLKSPTIAKLKKEGWVSVQSVIKEDIFWETIERLKNVGAQGILVLPIEKMII